MRKPIRRAAVIGAGVMGSGIAAHLANAGVEVLLMDIVPPGLDDTERRDRAARNRFAAAGRGVASCDPGCACGAGWVAVSGMVSQATQPA